MKLHAQTPEHRRASNPSIARTLACTPSFLPSLFVAPYVLTALASSPNSRANLVMATLLAGTGTLGPLLMRGKPLPTHRSVALFAVVPAGTVLAAVCLGGRATFATGPFALCSLYWLAALNTASQLRAARLMAFQVTGPRHGGLLAGSGACVAGLVAGVFAGRRAATGTDLIAIELVGFLVYTVGTYALELRLRRLVHAQCDAASTLRRLDLYAACEHLANLHFLTPRERQVFPLIAAGHSAAYAAERLGVKATTVRTHIRNIHRKLCVQTFDELIALVQGTMEATPTADILRGRQNPIPTQGRANSPTR